MREMKTYTWYNRSQKLDSADTVHQILVYGSLKDIQELINKLGRDKVAGYFISFPQKKYTRSAFLFTKNFILNIKKELDESRYLKRGR